MTVVAVIGAQWGHEGKGKIVDELSMCADYVVRYQGGSNAGHRVVHGKKEFVFRLVPSGILYPKTVCIIGNGVVVTFSNAMSVATSAPITRAGRRSPLGNFTCTARALTMT